MVKPTVASAKRVLIDKANARIVTYVSAAAFILVFSLVATKTLVGQAMYQNRVISKKRLAVSRLQQDVTATDTLKESYQTFTNTTKNVLGGNVSGTGALDGSNAKIVLDALPSAYDFPGLTTSLETLLGQQKVKINSISGTDDEVAQSGNQSSVTPTPVPIPFSVSVQGDYTSVQNVIGAFEHSIRPIQLQTISLVSNQGDLTLSVTAQTYYQPAKSLNIRKEVVR